MKREFHIGDILSITTGHLVSPRHIDGIYDILNFMTGDNLFTHQLPRAVNECTPFLLQQHPQLESVDASSVNEDNLEYWLFEQAAKFGPTLLIETLPEGAHCFRNPIDELVEKGKQVIVIKTGIRGT